MKEDTKGALLYVGIVAASLAAMFSIVASGIMGEGHTKVSVDPAKHEITQKHNRFLAVPYYSDVQTTTTVFNLDARTKTVTDSHTETATIIVNDKSKPTETSPITQADLDNLSQQSPEAAKLIKSLNL